ncbi:carbohydrate sulfotransferase 3-like isoform X2 [Photinus pyralis]|uniref:carbohydrate sulfotransferase 3-like isoform X2 n=1 Tax=Photinus pyralis TaxID=7054 RepID=UPI0012671655|nr:carbohydrate sulfotransferase 3-like isoform X2 [Photinus pyralis]
MPRVRFLGFSVVAAAAAFFLLVLSFNERPVSVYPKHSQIYSNVIQEEYAPHNYSYTSTIKDVIKQQGAFIEQATSDYPFPNNLKLQNFTLSSGGRPLRNIIITTWRSGSTFLGDIINAVPGNFYHYEPLLNYGIVQIRGPPYGDTAVKNLKKLLNCDYTDLDNYLAFGQTHVYLFTHNKRLWDVCELHQKYCWDPTFLSEFCKLFPFQSMKVVRLRLELAEELLKDESLNVRILLLVRDPRGTLQSRKHRHWCPGAPDCDQPNLLCEDIAADYETAIRFQNEYPTRFRAIRYEDLSIDPYRHVQDLFQFFQLHFHPSVKAFLDSHTKLNSGGTSSTFRHSKSAPFHWRTDLNFSEVQYIEKDCDQAMKLWGEEELVSTSGFH